MSHAQIDFGKLTTLVVDDLIEMRRLIRTILESFGFKNVVLADGVYQALHKLNECQIDLAIVDWNMKPLDGLKLVRMIRDGAAGRNRDLPIIMLTAYSDEHRVRQARNAGVNGYLVKPVSAETIYRRIISLATRGKLDLT